MFLPERMAAEMQGSPDGGRRLADALAGQHGSNGPGGTGTERLDVQTEGGGRQEAAIGQYGITATHIGVVFEERHAERFEQCPQRMQLAGLGRLGQALEALADLGVVQASLPHGGDHGDALQHVLPVPPEFPDGDAFRRREGQIGEKLRIGRRVEIIDKMDAGPDMNCARYRLMP